MGKPTIVRYESDYREQLLDLVISAWEPVFEKTRSDVPGFVYDNFWPNGWKARQLAEVSTLLESQSEKVWLAVDDGQVVGFVGLAIHPEDQMGEISIVAVSPGHQRQGVGKALIEFAEQSIRAAGMKMVMVETVGDSGHEPARRSYESLGYVSWPVARYFKRL
jgi:GNAT superfamily N-acetyltransferase